MKNPRFWNKVKRGPRCWPWIAYTHNGYGKYWNGKEKGLTSAHRVAWELGHGEIPKGKWVLHKCDNPCCVRPSHLFLGTPKDNTQDAVSKGRMTRGEAMHTAKLTEKQVKEIRTDTRKQCVIAKEYGVSFSNVSAIKRREKWKHVT